MIEFQTAINLKRGQTLVHVTLKNADKSPLRCRVNGKTKVWKTRPDDFKVPVKYGLKDCFYITPENANQWSLAWSQFVSGTPAQPISVAVAC